MTFRWLRLSSAFLILSLCGFGSCSGKLADVCSDRIERQYADAAVALTPWMNEGGRSLASISPMAPMDRASWKLWSEDRLKETQNYMDLTETEAGFSDVRKELSEMANELVAFHGYAQVGRVSRMVETLRQIEGRSRKIRGMVCK